jgi:hypothetical protein
VSGGLGHGFAGSCRCHQLHCVRGRSVQQRIDSCVHDMSGGLDHSCCAAGQYGNASAAGCTACPAGSATDSLAAAGARWVGTATHRQPGAWCVWRARPRIRWQLLVPSATLSTRQVGTATHRQLRARHVRQARPQLLRSGSIQQRIDSCVRGVYGGLGHGYAGSCRCHQAHCVRGESVQQRQLRVQCVQFATYM